MVEEEQEEKVEEEEEEGKKQSHRRSYVRIVGFPSVTGGRPLMLAWHRCTGSIGGIEKNRGVFSICERAS